MNRQGSNAKALKHGHDLIAKPEREWNMFRENVSRPLAFLSNGMALVKLVSMKDMDLPAFKKMRSLRLT